MLTAAAWVLLALPVVRAQAPLPPPELPGPTLLPPPRVFPYPNVPAPPGCTGPGCLPGAIPGTTPGAMPGTTPGTTPGTGGAPGGTGAPSDTQGGTGAADSFNTGADTGSGSNFDTAGLGGAGGSAVGGGAFTGVGYIDTAIPLSQYRLRIDAANDDNWPDRADFFYPKAGFYRTLAAQGLPNGDAFAPGPGTAPPKNVNFQELSNYLEIAFHPRFSAWIDVPVRWIDINFLGQNVQPQYNQGLSDIQFGFKAALVYRPTRVLTFQLRTFSPTGNAFLGLGRGDWNLEPGLLFYQRLASRLFFEGEVMDFIPLASANEFFAGNVLTYAGGLSYLAYNTPDFRIAPVAEFVGWTVLSGQETRVNVPVSAAGDTILNAKVGVRVGFGQLRQPGFINRADVYVGYGRALTGDVWYKNLARAEFRLRF